MRDFLFGIFESGKLIGAVQLTSSFRVRELRAQVNRAFDPTREKSLHKIVQDCVCKLDPAVQMRKALKNQLEDILTEPERPMGVTAMNGVPLLPGAATLSIDRKAKAQESLDKALDLITNYVKELREQHIIEDKQHRTLNRMAPQIIRRTVDQLGTKVPDSLRELVLRSKRPRARRETLPVPCALPLSD